MRNCVIVASLALLAAICPRSQADARDLVLAVSWQPAFCETKPSVPECRSQTEDRFDATHFSLHGLWPQPRGNVYCDVPPELVELDRRNGWNALPIPEISETVRQLLEPRMPGTASNLDRHEWIKHGTCYSPDSAEIYFADSLTLLSAINESGIRELFAQAVGGELHIDAVRAAFDIEFGTGAGERVELICHDAGPAALIVDLRIALSGEPGKDSVSKMLHNAPPRHSRCSGGLIDAVGFGG